MNKVALITAITGQDGAPKKLMDVSKLRQHGWSSSTLLKDGIKKTYDWFAINVNELREVN